MDLCEFQAILVSVVNFKTANSNTLSQKKKKNNPNKQTTESPLTALEKLSGEQKFQGICLVRCIFFFFQEARTQLKALMKELSFKRKAFLSKAKGKKK